MSVAHELAWCAGFFDGEGFITIQKRNRKLYGKVYVGHNLAIGINHVAIEPLLEMQRILGGNIQKQDPSKAVGNRKPRHRWIQSYDAARVILVKLMPYLKNKNKVAALALDFAKTVSDSKDKRAGLSEEVFQQREFYKQEIQRLNSLD